MTHTPTTGQVRKSYVEGVEHDCYYEGDVTTTPDGVYVGEVFDLWHAEEIRRAKLEAIEDLAKSNQVDAFDTAVDMPRVRGPLFITLRTWLTREYEKIAKGTE